MVLGGGGAEPAPQSSPLGASASYLVQQLSYADTWSMVFIVEQAFDQIVNWYSPDSETITISALPLDEEIAPYWDNWSAALTGSRWDWRWRLRYAALAEAINAHIGKRERYDDVSFEALEDDCATLTVDQPAAETMAPYASAFFVRWQALLNEDLPPLAELYQTYLEPHWRDRLIPGVALAREVDFVDWVYSDFSTAYMDGEVLVQRFANFTAEGELRLIEVGSLEDDEGIRLTVRYGLSEGKQKTVIEDLRVPLEKDETLFFDIMAALSLGPDRFILASSDLWDSSNGVRFSSSAEPVKVGRIRFILPSPVNRMRKRISFMPVMERPTWISTHMTSPCPAGTASSSILKR